MQNVLWIEENIPFKRIETVDWMEVILRLKEVYEEIRRRFGWIEKKCLQNA